MIVINYQDPRPIYEQIVWRFRELIMNDLLVANTQLPSIRNLAMELSINPNTIQRAYSELERQDLIYSVKGKGIFVKENNNLAELKQHEVFSDLKNVVKKAKNMNIEKIEFLKKTEELMRLEGLE